MPGLGIAGATPFAMPSNHQTAFNHSFRDTAPYNPLQPRVKCSFCGVWAKKGAPCYLCRRWVKGVPAPRDNSVRVEPSRSSSNASHVDPATPRNVRPASAAARRSASSSADRGSYAEAYRSSISAAKTPSAAADTSTKPLHDKVKCRSCGCWATKGKPCRLCHTITI